MFPAQQRVKARLVQLTPTLASAQDSAPAPGVCTRRSMTYPRRAATAASVATAGRMQAAGSLHRRQGPGWSLAAPTRPRTSGRRRALLQPPRALTSARAPSTRAKGFRTSASRRPPGSRHCCNRSVCGSRALQTLTLTLTLHKQPTWRPLDAGSGSGRTAADTLADLEILPLAAVESLPWVHWMHAARCRSCALQDRPRRLPGEAPAGDPPGAPIATAAVLLKDALTL